MHGLLAALAASQLRLTPQQNLINIMIHTDVMKHRNLRGGGCPASLLLSITSTPIIANATTTPTATTVTTSSRRRTNVFATTYDEHMKNVQAYESATGTNGNATQTQ